MKGEVKLVCFKESYKQILRPGIELAVGHDLLTVNAVKNSPKALIVHFNGIENRDGARLLSGKECLVKQDFLEELEIIDDYFAEQWLYFEVQDLTGNLLGVVDEIIYTGSNDVLSVMNGKEEILVPVTEEYILEEDLNNKKLIVKRPELI